MDTFFNSVLGVGICITNNIRLVIIDLCVIYARAYLLSFHVFIFEFGAITDGPIFLWSSCGRGLKVKTKELKRISRISGPLSGRAIAYISLIAKYICLYKKISNLLMCLR